MATTRHLPCEFSWLKMEETVATEITGLLETRCSAEIRIARSREGALAIIKLDEDYDLIVCDLRIPTQDGGLDVARGPWLSGA